MQGTQSYSLLEVNMVGEENFCYQEIQPKNENRVQCGAIVEELLVTEEEFIQDIESLIDNYYEPLLKSKFSKHTDSIFGPLKDILDFHKRLIKRKLLDPQNLICNLFYRVLYEGLKYAADENNVKLIGRTFMRLVIILTLFEICLVA